MAADDLLGVFECRCRLDGDRREIDTQVPLDGVHRCGVEPQNCGERQQVASRSEGRPARRDTWSVQGREAQHPSPPISEWTYRMTESSNLGPTWALRKPESAPTPPTPGRRTASTAASSRRTWWR